MEHWECHNTHYIIYFLHHLLTLLSYLDLSGILATLTVHYLYHQRYESWHLITVTHWPVSTPYSITCWLPVKYWLLWLSLNYCCCLLIHSQSCNTYAILETVLALLTINSLCQWLPKLNLGVWDRKGWRVKNLVGEVDTVCKNRKKRENEKEGEKGNVWHLMVRRVKIKDRMRRRGNGTRRIP